jgi:UDP-N-acetylmuramate--alanine ligase
MKDHYHFIGVGGVGMGALASLMMAKGYKVSGSDLKESPLFLNLKEAGAQVFLGHDRENLRRPDYVVYSSAVREDNPEMMAAKDQKIPIIRRAELLAQLMNNHVGITVAGAHGKTTTTSMVSLLLIKAGLQPTTAIGGLINGQSYNANLGKGQYFVAEVDESDGSFLFFRPQYSIITNIDYEHLDYYHNWENILLAYYQFITRTQPNGIIVVNGDDKNLRELISRGNRKYITYGFGKDNHVIAKGIVLTGYGSRFICQVGNKDLGTVELSVPGEHNVHNALACISLGLAINLEFTVIQESLKAYQGVKRRFQVLGEAKDISVVDDYGHHPTEIKATLKAAQEVKKKRLITIFQPHRFSRTKFLMKDFVESLLLSDYIIVTDIYAASEAPIPGVSAEILCEELKARTKKPVFYLPKDHILSHLKQITQAGDLVLTLGAGDIYRVGEALVKELGGEVPAERSKTSINSNSGMLT